MPAMVRGLAVAVLLLVGGGAQAVEKLVWRFPTPGFVSGVQPLPNGNVVVSEKGANLAVEVTPTRPAGATVVRSYGTGVSDPDNVRELADGDFLIASTLAF